jgi:hypothetical protein
LGPGEVKELTLEQLDDFFRLEIIDERTLIWQSGMAQWLPLGMVAGIESPSQQAVTPSASSVIPIAPSYPASTLQAAAVVAPATKPTAPNYPVSKPQTVASVAPSIQPITPSFPVSTAPLAISVRPEEPSHRGQSWLFRAAIAAGLLLTLYRNDVLFSAAQAARQQGEFSQAERRMLGGPPFGTSRSVDQLIAEGGGRLEPVRLPYIVTQMHEASTPAAAMQPNGLGSAVADQPNTSAKGNEPKQPSGEAAAALAGHAKPKYATVKSASTPRVARKSSSRDKSVFRKGDANDPLNPSL